MHRRLSFQQRTILAILRKKRDWIYFDTVQDGLLMAMGLTSETESFRSSMSRTIKQMDQKGLIGLRREQWIVGNGVKLPIWRFARLTRFGRWLADWLDAEESQKSASASA